MSSRKLILVIFLSLLSLLYVRAVGQYHFVQNGIYYYITQSSTSGNYVEVSGSYSNVVTIPSTVTNRGTTYIVKQIGFNAFENCTTLTSVTIPNSVTSIGEHAFDGCSGLTNLTLSDSIRSIGNYAFRNCINLTNLVLPDSIRYLGDYAFSGCVLINDLTIPDNVNIGSKVFSGCINITQPIYNNSTFVFMPTSYSGSYTIQDGITKIAGGAFENCIHLTNVTIPTSVTTIGEYSFKGCVGLTDETVPNSVSNVGHQIFYGSGIMHPIFNDSIFIYLPTSYNGDFIIPSGIKYIAVGAFENCGGLNSVTIPNSVISIGEAAFRSCSSLSSITIPKSVEYIRSNAFWNCSCLTNVYFKRLNLPSFVPSNVFNYGNTSTSTVYFSNINFHVPCDSASFRSYSDALGTYYRFVSNWMSYDLVVQSSDSTLGTASISQNATCNSPAIINATVTANHYHFHYWSDNNTDNPRTISITNDTSIIAIFAIDKHTITASGTHGSISGVGTYDYGTTVDLTAIPDDHYYFARWTDNDTTNPRTITVNSNKTYIAIFEGNMHTITTNAANGTVSGGGSYHYGSTVTLTAVGDTHYHFARWSDGNTSNPRNITVNGNNTYTAIFEIDKHTVSASGSNGAISGTGSYDYGSTATLTATPNAHYHFVEWADGDTTNPRSITVYSNCTYNATFEIDKHNVNVSGPNGVVTGGGTYDYGKSVTLMATADDHYHFVGWSDGDASNPRNIVVSRDSTYTALFEIDKHTVAVDANNCTITGEGEYDYGTLVTLTAVPDEHYCDVTWSDGDSVLSKSFVITEDVNYTADFAKCQYVVNATCEHGEVTGNGIYENPDIVTLYVETYDGYRFVEWSDGEVYNPRVFVVEGDLEVEAICEAVTGVEDVEESVAFYYVRGRVVNPEEVMLRVYSTEGKMVKSGDGDIETEGMPAGMYMVVDERGRSLKVVVKP